MKLLVTIAAGLFVTTGASAATRPTVQHYGNPTMNGQRLPFTGAAAADAASAGPNALLLDTITLP